MALDRRMPSISTMSQPQSKSVYKLITLGDDGVGKSSLIATYTRGTYEERAQHPPPVSTKFEKMEHKLVQLEIWDTAGQERFDSITPNYYRGAHGCLLCFDLSRPESADSLMLWIERLRKYNDRAPMILVGMKADLRHSQHSTRPLDNCKILAHNLGLPYREVSSKKIETVNTAFEHLIKTLDDIYGKNTTEHHHSQPSRPISKKPCAILEKLKCCAV